MLTKILHLIIILLFVFVSLIAVYFAGFVPKNILLISTPDAIIRVAGTGSMFPTFPKAKKEDENKSVDEVEMQSFPGGVIFFNKRYFQKTLKLGDLVAIESELSKKLTSESEGLTSGLLKRVIGLPGDKLRFVAGDVFRNGQLLEEKYLARQKATHGSDIFPDCKDILVPTNQIFVMGDNRQESMDSRHELGFVSISDIHYYLPWESQEALFADRWQANATAAVALMELTTDQILPQINQIRANFAKRPLKLEPKLALSAHERALAIITSNDFSFEATQSALTMKQAMQNAGYDNITWGEIPLKGRFSAEELTNRLTNFPSSKKFILDENFQDFGMSDAIANQNNCPQIVTVLHFAGWKPAHYEKSVIDSWEKAITQIDTIAPAWQEAFGRGHPASEKIKTILEKLALQRQIAESVVSKMRASQWLTDIDEANIKQFEGLNTEIQSLASQINQ